MTNSNTVSKTRYQKNLDFWETAWSRVKQASTKIPDVLDYIPEIPEVFAQHQCEHILDIACGSGWLSFYLNAFGFQVTGVDISQSAINLANEQKQEALNNPANKIFLDLEIDKTDLSKVDFLAADMFALEFPENSFDGILINAAFEHLDKKRGREFILEMKKLLRPGAILFAVFDKVASGSKGDFDVLEDGTHQYKDEFRDGMFLRNYSDDELTEILTEAEFELLSIRKNNYESRIVVAKNIK